ncbi:DegT/DnrJ/EryC1/StrS family aminotransferase [Thermodesulfobacteriota bacterium]
MHQQTAFAHLEYATGEFPVSEDTVERVLSLPMHPYLETTQIESVCKIISQVENR